MPGMVFCLQVCDNMHPGTSL